jgi:hypothetical protein
LEIPVKTLVCVKIESAESHSQNSSQWVWETEKNCW